MSVLVLLTGMSRVSVPDAPMSSRALWRIDLAKASLPELQLLPGIGPVLAARIEAWRRRSENLDALDDLLHIHGIGPHTIRNLQPLVSVTASSSPGEFKNED
ncbi:MAG: helix-hairpin-helix domain-containing protein [Phycisphaerales bacterium]|nr:helix-hairpin-helix domain-containing protein [Phycisphaerales bacterium]